MTDLHKAVLANLDALKDDAAAHIFPSDLRKCMTSECVVEVMSVRAGNPDERTVPLFSREQVDEALREALAKPAVPPGYALVPVEPMPEMVDAGGYAAPQPKEQTT